MSVEHVGRETTAKTLGETWHFSRWTRSVWARIAEEARKDLPDPIECMLKHIDKAALKDAEIIRRLEQQDAHVISQWQSNQKNGQAPQPPLMLPRFTPVADHLAKLALDKASLYLDFNSPELTSWLRSPVGASFAFAELLRPHHPDMDEDRAYEIVVALGREEVERIIKTTQGILKDTGPNAEAPAA
jgi:hypothetical protein